MPAWGVNSTPAWCMARDDEATPAAKAADILRSDMHSLETQRKTTAAIDIMNGGWPYFLLVAVALASQLTRTSLNHQTG